MSKNNKRNILQIADVSTGDVYFVSDSLKELIQDNIELLLNGGSLKGLGFAGKNKTLKLSGMMRFVLEQEDNYGKTKEND